VGSYLPPGGHWFSDTWSSSCAALYALAISFKVLVNSLSMAALVMMAVLADGDVEALRSALLGWLERLVAGQRYTSSTKGEGRCVAKGAASIEAKRERMSPVK
jgi:hypothetical protein